MVEDLREQHEIKPVIEPASLKYDFELIHNKYFVLKSGVDIYYYNLI